MKTLQCSFQVFEDEKHADQIDNKNEIMKYVRIQK